MQFYTIPVVFCAAAVFTLFSICNSNVAGDLDNGMSTETDWRCGIFLMPNPSGPPTPPQKVWTFPTKFRTMCTLPMPSMYNRTCYEIMRQSFRMWNYGQPSKADTKSGKSIGDDFCSLIGQEEYYGREVGFFFNFCGRGDWIDTSLRRKERICCRGGKYVSCSA